MMHQHHSFHTKKISLVTTPSKEFHSTLEFKSVKQLDKNKRKFGTLHQKCMDEFELSSIFL